MKSLFLFLVRKRLYVNIASIGFFLFVSNWGIYTLERQADYHTIIYINLASELLRGGFLLSLVGMILSIGLNVSKMNAKAFVANLLLGVLLLGGIVGYIMLNYSLPLGLAHVTSVRSDNHSYNLAYDFPSYHGEGTLSYIVYQCDSLSILCQVVYRDSGREFSLFQHALEYNFDAPPPPFNAKLLTDATNNTVSLELDGEVVYTHQAEE